MRMTDSPERLFVLIFGGVALLLLGIALALTLPQLWFLGSAQLVTGRVVALEYSSDTDGTSARPVVSYEVNGDEYRITGEVWSQPPLYTVGDPVDVRYPAGQPRAGRIGGFVENWIAPTIVGGIGSVFGILTLAFWWAGRGTRRDLL